MKKTFHFLAALSLFFTACAQRKAMFAREKAAIYQTVAGGFRSPAGLAVYSENVYFISHLDENGKGAISKVADGKTEPFASGLVSPAGLSADWRWGRLFAADGNAVLVYKAKNKTAEPVRIELPVKTKLTDVFYSTMNARVYASSAGDRTVWEVNPKKKTVKTIAGPELFDRLKVGAPARLYVSTDGAQLRITTAPSEDASALLKLELRDGRADLLKRFGDRPEFAGMDVYHSYMILADAGTGKFAAVRLKDGAPGTVLPPSEWRGKAVLFAMDLHRILALSPAENGTADLIRFPIVLKE